MIRLAYTLLYIMFFFTGCATRYPSTRMEYALKDSLKLTWRDSTFLEQRRRVAIELVVHTREIVLTPPDSLGRQYVKNITEMTEKWEGKDSSFISSERQMKGEKDFIREIDEKSNVSIEKQKGLLKVKVFKILICVLLLALFIIRSYSKHKPIGEKIITK